MAACSVDTAGPDETADHTDDALSACSVSVTTNNYAGDPDYWGTITFKNVGDLVGGDDLDTFVVNSGVTGAIDGGGKPGQNTIEGDLSDLGWQNALKSETWYGKAAPSRARSPDSFRARASTRSGEKRSTSRLRAYGFATSKTLKSG